MVRSNVARKGKKTSDAGISPQGEITVLIEGQFYEYVGILKSQPKKVKVVWIQLDYDPIPRLALESVIPAEEYDFVGQIHGIMLIKKAEKDWKLIKPADSHEKTS